MKTIRKYITLILFSLFILENNVNAQNSTVSFQVFYDNLSPYGNWVMYPDYGYVWIPALGPDFFPYSTGGYWAYTEFGWTWVSDYAWGWAPFHYGRWHYDPFYGWLWIPGNEWGPAWVVWRRSPGYYGWAPLAPGISINLVFSDSYHPPHEHWVFVNEQYIGRPDINNYYGPRKDNSQLVHNSTIINNTREDKNRSTIYITGPDKNEVQKARGKEIEPITVRETDKPDQTVKDKQITIYRPRISKSSDAKPVRVTDKSEIKGISEPRNQGTESPRKQEAPIEKKREGTEKPLEIKPPAPKEQAAPIKKDQPQPVVPDNTRTKKQVPKAIPRGDSKVKEAPQSQQKTIPQKKEEKNKPLLPSEKQPIPKREIPVQPKVKPTPMPTPPSAPKQTPRTEPRKIPKETRQGPRVN